MDTEAKVREWIDTQHGTAGWEQKLVNLVEVLVQKRDSFWIEKLEGMRMYPRRANDHELFKQGYNKAVEENNQKLDALIRNKYLQEEEQ
jgi:hypothetical protein